MMPRAGAGATSSTRSCGGDAVQRRDRSCGHVVRRVALLQVANRGHHTRRQLILQAEQLTEHTVQLDRSQDRSGV